MDPVIKQPGFNGKYPRVFLRGSYGIDWYPGWFNQQTENHREDHGKIIFVGVTGGSSVVGINGKTWKNCLKLQLQSWNSSESMLA